jgi:ATP-dependent Clp protease, protease subunit
MADRGGGAGTTRGPWGGESDRGEVNSICSVMEKKEAMSKKRAGVEAPPEIAFIGDLGDQESEITEKLLEVPPKGECTIYFDCPGGSAYSAISLMTIISLRQLQATGIVTGECSSAALWPFAVCTRRIVTPFSVFLFHPMRWQSEENVQLPEAREWARHFGDIESEMERLLAVQLGASYEQIAEWIRPGRYISGREFAAAGLAELVEWGGRNNFKDHDPLP